MVTTNHIHDYSRNWVTSLCPLGAGSCPQTHNHHRPTVKVQAKGDPMPHSSWHRAVFHQWQTCSLDHQAHPALPGFLGSQQCSCWRCFSPVPSSGSALVSSHPQLPELALQLKSNIKVISEKVGSWAICSLIGVCCGLSMGLWGIKILAFLPALVTFTD